MRTSTDRRLFRRPVVCVIDHGKQVTSPTWRQVVKMDGRSLRPFTRIYFGLPVQS